MGCKILQLAVTVFIPNQFRQAQQIGLLDSVMGGKPGLGWFGGSCGTGLFVRRYPVCTAALVRLHSMGSAEVHQTGRSETRKDVGKNMQQSWCLGAFLQRLSDLIGPYTGTYKTVYKVLQMLVLWCSDVFTKDVRFGAPPRLFLFFCVLFFLRVCVLSVRWGSEECIMIQTGRETFRDFQDIRALIDQFVFTTSLLL